MSYDVLELRELEYERYVRHPVVREYNCLDRWKEKYQSYIFCEIYINGTRLQELLPLSIDEGEEMLYEVGWFDDFKRMLRMGRRDHGYFPILWDGMHDPASEGDVTVHVRMEGDDVIWDGFFQSYSNNGIKYPLGLPIFRFEREQYESAIRTFCREYGVPCT